ncbi:sulfur oxidation c-type cytochrome SoxA [Paracoccus saliphilus]|uniref:SoxAX cytochrome complex subunit A n=2 Tax=Paracoccus saliphilus TaxID=405559 RepID=A0AA45W6P5_9RHOB|nr:sulfur oxidation c-type cytochrome SoxA [Paracoccus saliphilus]SIT03326.1 diheme cytochrome SoxA (sulfur oxidation) [Paracoccus saliphilus]
MTTLIRPNVRAVMASALVLALSSPAMAQTEPEHTDPIVINGGEVEMQTAVPAPDHLEGAFDQIYSGWLFRDTETQAMQLDDFENPGLIFVDQGIDDWNTVEGEAGKSCASCHEGIESMEGLRAEVPKVNAEGELWAMEDYINDCRTNRMQAEALDWNGGRMKNLTAAISMQSRGMPMNVAIDGPAQPYWEQGKEMYYTRFGQLELACANCHEDHYGDWIRADHLSQGMTNGFPVYRLKQAALVSQHNRFRGCIRDTRAETFAMGTDEFRALELYVASRGNGLPVEGVSVRH